MPTSPSRLVSFTRLAGRLAIIAGGALGLAAVPHAEASAVFASFNPLDPPYPTTGTLDGVGFAITVTGGAAQTISTGDFNGSAFDGSGSQSVLQYEAETVFIEFDQAVSDFSLYLYNFRGANDPIGAQQYVFNEGFTLNGNFEGGSYDGTTQPTLSTPGDSVNGILSFTGPIEWISWTAYAQGSPVVVPGSFTFAGTASASAVPGAGLAGLATVGLAGVARRRRR